MLSYVNDSDTMSKWKSCGEGTHFAAALQRAAQRVAEGLDVIKGWVKGLIEDALSKIFGEIQTALDEFGKSLYNQIMSIENLLEGEDGNVSILEGLIKSPVIKFLLQLPLVLLTVYLAISIVTMGLGAVVMNLVVGVIAQLIISNMIKMPSGSAPNFSTGGEILNGIASFLGAFWKGVIDNITVIKVVMAIVGVIISMVILLQSSIYSQGQIFMSRLEVKDIDESIEYVLTSIRGASDVTVDQVILNVIRPLIQDEDKLLSIISKARTQLTGNPMKMSMLGVAFAVLSLVMIIVEYLIENIFNKNLSTEQKAIFFGLSIGFGIGGIITNVYSLITSGYIPGIRFLSILGMILSGAGVIIGVLGK